MPEKALPNRFLRHFHHSVSPGRDTAQPGSTAAVRV